MEQYNTNSLLNYIIDIIVTLLRLEMWCHDLRYYPFNPYGWKNVRVGFEDNLYLSRGVLAKSNGELVDKVVQMAKLLGREIASPADARRILGLK